MGLRDLFGAPPRQLSAPPAADWVPPGASITARNLVIPGGMFYVGPWLPAVGFDGPDPALIDLRLPVTGPPDWAGHGMGYWPSYSEIPPVSRAAYLEWLAGGRRDPRAYIGYVFLFFYGLERRVLVDCAVPGPARADLPAIRFEVERLLNLYGGNRSFHGYASGFLDVLDVVTGQWTDEPPTRTGERWRVPLALRRGLGRFAAGGAPIPAGWALAWSWFHPELDPRTPAWRCTEEYERLFLLRYRERYDEGIRVRPNRATVGLAYNPASAGLPQAHFDLRLPDVFPLVGPARKLAAIAGECTDALDAYSRWLGRNPDGRGTLSAAALLPGELLDTRAGPVAGLFAWADARLDGGDTAVVPAGELIAHWPSGARTQDGRLAKKDATALAQLLGHGGFGIEPDPRFGGMLPAAGPAVLFRSAGPPSAVASDAYNAASALLHLAAAVSQADGQVAESEREHLVAHLETGLDLTEAEKTRLRAHLQWLLETGAKLTVVKRWLDDLPESGRARIGEFLVTVAAADGTVSAAEVTLLTKIYRLLGLDPDDVHGALHTAAVSPPTTAPVTVRPGEPRPAGYAIPRPAPAPAADPAGIEVRLDPDAIARKIAETAEVGSMLGAIFTDEDEPERPAPVPVRPAVVAVAGLDAPHSGLLRALGERNRWSRAEFEELAGAWGVLPDGALDTLNDAAYDMAGDPLADGEDPIEIDNDVLGELLK